MQIKLTLDKKVDEDIILALQKKANGGALSKALYRAILEWHSDRAGRSTVEAQNDHIEAQEMKEPGPDELTQALADIEENW